MKKLRGQDHSLGVTSLAVHCSVVTANVRTMHSSDELISQNIRACCAENIKILSFAPHGKVIFELAQEVHFPKRNEKRMAVSAFPLTCSSNYTQTGMNGMGRQFSADCATLANGRNLTTKGGKKGF